MPSLSELVTDLTYVDDFNGWSDGTDLSENPSGLTLWSFDVLGGANTCGYWQDSTQAQGTGDPASNYWDGPAVDDCRIALTYSFGSPAPDSSHMLLWVRVEGVGSGTTGYRFRWYQNSLGTDSFAIERIDGGAFESDYVLLTDDESGTFPIAPGDVIAFEVVGDVLTAYLNDFSTVLITTTDATYTTGTFAIGNQNFQVFLDDCYLGEVTSGPTVPEIAGSMSGVGTASCSLRAMPRIAGTIAGTSTLSGTVSRKGLIAGTMAGTSTLTGTVKVTAFVAGTMAGTSTLTGTINFIPGIAGQMDGVSSLTAAANAPPHISGTTAGTGALTATVEFPASPPVNIVAPTLSGDYVSDITAGVYLPATDAEVTITVDPGTWTGSPDPTFEYEFFSSLGHTFQARSSDDSLVLTKSADLSFHDVNCRVYGTNDSGESFATLVNGLYVFRTPEPNHLGPDLTLDKAIADVGTTVTVSNPDDGNWTGFPPFTFTYQWVQIDPDTEDAFNISGATSASYTATMADVGFFLSCTVTATTPTGETGDTFSENTDAVSLLRGTATGHGTLTGGPRAPAAVGGTMAGHGSATAGLRALGRPPLTFPVNLILDATLSVDASLNGNPVFLDFFAPVHGLELDENAVNVALDGNTVNALVDDNPAGFATLDENTSNATLDGNTVNNELTDVFP